MRGRLITIEGLDGSGKTTLADGLVEALRDVARDVLLCASPAGVELSERIRALVKDPGLAIDPRAEALLYAAARAQLVAERVEPALSAGTWVLLDRFVDSSLAYQGVGRGLGIEAVAEINHFATGGLRPDRTLLLRADAATRRGAPGGSRRGARPARARGGRLLRRHRRCLRRAGGGRARALPRARRGGFAGGRARGGAGRVGRRRR
jgi:dTMP kinase